MRLTTASMARLGPPGGNRRVRELDREAAALAQGGVIRRPVRELVSLPWTVVPAIGVGFDGHGRGPWIRKGETVLLRSIPGANQPIRATR